MTYLLREERGTHTHNLSERVLDPSGRNETCGGTLPDGSSPVSTFDLIRDTRSGVTLGIPLQVECPLCMRFVDRLRRSPSYHPCTSFSSGLTGSQSLRLVSTVVLRASSTYHFSFSRGVVGLFVTLPPLHGGGPVLR